jgi:YfiH family protein
MQLSRRLPCGDAVAHVRTSTVADGDFHIEGDRRALLHRRRAFVDGPWTQLDEVHGTEVRVVTKPGEHDLAVGDAAVTSVPGAVLAVWVGDCAPVVLVGDRAVAVAHAGWKGALDGVLQRTVAAMPCAPGSDAPMAVLGPCIHACCYEFGEDLLARFVERYGAEVAGATTWGTPALDMPAVVRAALAEVGVTDLADDGVCTRCDPRWFSHRRGDAGRHVMCVRMMEPR